MNKRESMDCSIDCNTSTTLCDQEAEVLCKKKLKSFLTQVVKFVDEMKAFFELESKAIVLIWKMTVQLKELDTK